MRHKAVARARRSLIVTAADARRARCALDATIDDLAAQLRMALQLVADLSADRKDDIDRLRRIASSKSLEAATRIARNRLDSLI